jgi:hypothetical protein
MDFLGLQLIPSNPQAVNSWLKSWGRDLPQTQADFLNLLARSYLDAGPDRGMRAISLFDYVDELRVGWRRFVDSNPGAEARLLDSWARLQAEIKLRRFWDDFGQDALKHDFDKNGVGQIWIGDKSYTAKKLKDSGGRESVVFLVPRSQISHPSWNPISDGERLGLLEAEKLKFPDRYRVQIGQQGEIFLLDGNKRSELDPRALLPVEIPWPPEKSSWRSYFDDIGYVQPSLEEIRQMQLGMDPMELLRQRRLR